MSYTKGPWHVMETGFGNKAKTPCVYSADEELRYITSCADFLNITPTDNLANANRIVACVNACTGMIDPQAEITALRARVAELESGVVIDCKTCANKGVAKDLTQETYCDFCVHGPTWKLNYYERKK